MFRSLVYVWVVLIFVLVGVEFALAAETAPAAALKPAPSAEEVDFDARLNSLMSAKTCIANAKTKADVQACQRAMRLDSRKKVEGRGL